MYDHIDDPDLKERLLKARAKRLEKESNKPLPEENRITAETPIVDLFLKPVPRVFPKGSKAAKRWRKFQITAIAFAWLLIFYYYYDDNQRRSMPYRNCVERIKRGLKNPEKYETIIKDSEADTITYFNGSFTFTERCPGLQ